MSVIVTWLRDGQTGIRQQIWTLFLICSVPVNLWSILLLLRDYDWVLEQFSFDVYLGYAGYALVGALLESVILAGVLFLLGILVSPNWGADTRKVVLIVSLGVVTLWAVAGQVYFLLLESPPGWMAWILLRMPYHRNEAMIALWGLVISSAVLPIFFVLKGSRLKTRILAFTDRLMVLARFYLALDGLALIWVIFRLATAEI